MAYRRRLGSQISAAAGACRRNGRVGGAAVAAGTGAALAAATPRQAQCGPFEHPTAESACCMLALGALQLGAAARWALYPEALASDFRGGTPTDPKRDPNPKPAPDPEPELKTVFSEHLDKETNRMYYCNVETREVVWELPAGAAVQEKRQDTEPAAQVDQQTEQQVEQQTEQQTEQQAEAN